MDFLLYLLYIKFCFDSLTLCFRQLLVKCNREQSIKVKNMISELEAEPGFTAAGFFTIERSTLTSIGGIILTYLVILISLNTTAEPDKGATVQPDKAIDSNL